MVALVSEIQQAGRLAIKPQSPPLCNADSG